MGTTTTTYALNKPTVGGDDNTWGTDWNTNADKLDDLLDGTTAIKPNLTEGQWKVGGVAVTASAAELNVLDGVTASTAELNILDGATLTTTELNYVDGVTSAIQTQLNGKISSALELLGTLTTSSGTTHTLSGLDLTPYTHVVVVASEVRDGSATSGTFSVAGVDVGATGTDTLSRIWGTFTIYLVEDGVLFGTSETTRSYTPPYTFTSPSVVGGFTAMTTASTSISVTMTTTSFAGGTVRIYGVR